MELKEIVAISGKGGLFQSVTTRQDGLIVRSLDDDKTIFVSARMHTFTPLENISVFTQDDSTDLKEVFLKMKQDAQTNPPVDANSDPATLKEYFRKIVPDFDDERVYNSDIKKIIKWYRTVDQLDLIKEEKNDEKKEKKESKKKDKKENETKKDKTG